MREPNSDRQPSFEEQIENKTPRELKEMLTEENRELGRLGVTVPIDTAIYAVRRHGHTYEDKPNQDGIIRITPMNLFAAIIHHQPALKDLSLVDFENLEKHVSRMAMTIEVLVHKIGHPGLPSELSASPQAVYESHQKPLGQ